MEKSFLSSALLPPFGEVAFSGKKLPSYCTPNFMFNLFLYLKWLKSIISHIIRGLIHNLDFFFKRATKYFTEWGYWPTIPLITHLNPFQLFNIIRQNNHFYAWRPSSIFRKTFLQQSHKNEAEIKANRCFSGFEIPIPKLLSKRFLRFYTVISNVSLGI